jgi:lycopene cyclase domain-containing protein
MSNYFLIDLFALLPTFLLSFHRKIEFYKNWKFLFPAIGITAIFFITWDIAFTQKAVWGFNREQIYGIYFFNLPLEEILFFIVVPYSSIFTYEVIQIFHFSELPVRIHKGISILVIIFSLMLAFRFNDHLYTFYVFLLTSVLLILFEFILRVSWMKRLYTAFALLLVPFIIMNGFLTSTLMGSVVVWYNSSQFTGLRLLTIPVEDIFYGLSLILMNIAFYEFFKKKANSRIGRIH